MFTPFRYPAPAICPVLLIAEASVGTQHRAVISLLRPVTLFASKMLAPSQDPPASHPTIAPWSLIDMISAVAGSCKLFSVGMDIVASQVHVTPHTPRSVP